MTDGLMRDVARRAIEIASELAEFSRAPNADAEIGRKPTLLPPGNDLLVEYDRRVTDQELRTATRTRFVSEHYADAVEAGVKALCDCIRARSGSVEDGDSLMTNVFSVNKPILRINAGKSKSDESEQRGHMMLCQGVVGAWRNPRAHSLIDDSPEKAMMMLEVIGSLMATVRSATRTRRKKST